MAVLKIFFPLILVLILCYLGANSVGLPVVVIVGGSGLLAWVAWLRYNYSSPAAPEVILVPFLLTCGALMLHIIEEYVMNFPEAMDQLFHIHFNLRTFIETFALVGPAIYFFTAVGLWYRNSLANFIAWFIFLGPGLAEFTHAIFPLLAWKAGLTTHYAYFPGLYTFYLPMIPGIYGILS